MRILHNNTKGNVGGRRLSTTLKSQTQAQPGLNDLRKNLKERKDLETYVRQLISTSDVRPLMETLSLASEKGPATVTGWFTVNMAKCAGLPDSAIYTALNWVMMPLKMDIFNFRRSGPVDNNESAEFMLDSSLYAKRLNRLQQQVMVMYTCQPLEVHVRPGLPIIDAAVSAEFEKEVEAALRGRYNVATCTLDLSRFHADPHLSQHFCPLHVVKFLEGTLVVARREFQHKVTGIILSNNYLCTLKAFAAISTDDFSALERLDISANKINDLAELKYLRNLSIKTLLLSGNEVAKLESDDIQTILPELKEIHGLVQSKPRAVLLDNQPNFQQLQGGGFSSTGHDISANKINDLAELMYLSSLQSKPREVLDKLPKFQQFQDGGSGSTGFEFVQRFVKCYYESFDEPTHRHQLTKLYDNKATFSLSVSKQLNRVSVYNLYNRNHTTLHSSFARNGKLQVGNLALTQALERFPRMLTSIQGTSSDVLMFNNRSRILALTGHFKEHTSRGWEQRYFQRTFVLYRPEGHAGWLITNDMLSIITPHVDQEVPIATALPPPNYAIKPEINIPSSPIDISDSEEESTSTSSPNASPKLVMEQGPIAIAPPKYAIKPEINIPSSPIEISDSEEESTSVSDPMEQVPIAIAPLKYAIKPEVNIPSSPIEISDSEDESTSSPNASPKLNDPMELAVDELSLSIPKMALATEAHDQEMMPPSEMPPLVEIPPMVTPVMLSPATSDLDQECLDLDIDSSLASDDLVIDEEDLLGDDLVIDEEVLFGDDLVIDEEDLIDDDLEDELLGDI